MTEIEIEIDKEVFLPCYRHLQDDTGIDIDFVYGSRDSGKSRDTAQRLVLKCLSDDYFRHILARKTFNTIKDSQWQVIKDVVDDWKLNDFFTFTTKPVSDYLLQRKQVHRKGIRRPAQDKVHSESVRCMGRGGQRTKRR
jgi:phage terminase large subunit